MNRVKASLIHLALSAFVFALTVALVVTLWYPWPYFWIDGGWQFIRLAAAVDLVLGPVLTLIVFRSSKPGLKFDLAAIGAMQILALGWGSVLMYTQRPAFLVFSYDTFRTVTWEQIEVTARTRAELVALSPRTPGVVFLELPGEKREVLKMVEAARRGEAPSVQCLGDRYRFFSPEHAEAAAAHRLDFESLLRERPEDRAKVKAFLESAGKQASDVLFLPVQARYSAVTAGVDLKKGEFLGFLDVIPPTPM